MRIFEQMAGAPKEGRITMRLDKYLKCNDEIR